MTTLFSPAKINLFLKIVGKRSDSYHELASLFQTIGLGDTLTFDINPDSFDEDTMTCSNCDIPTDGFNLVLQAVELYRHKSGKAFSVKVHLEKVIPHCAGLGGGSGNAATTLWALNSFFNDYVSKADLREIAEELGCDVPFFLSEGTAYCTKKGEDVRLLPPLPDSIKSLPVTIVKPSRGLSTPDVYGNLDLSNLQSMDPEQALLDVYSEKLQTFNDLEMGAFKLDSSLQSLKGKLESSGFSHVLLCGSGSALFCLGEGTVPNDPDLSVYHTHFINRTKGQWYQPTSSEALTSV